MIKTKKDLKSYLEQDKSRYVSGGPGFVGYLMHTERYYVFKYIKQLRKTEYWINNQDSLFGRIMARYHQVILYRLMHKTQMYLYPNVFGPGLFIPHLGRMLTPPQAKFGKNCTLRPGLLVASNLGPNNTKLISLIVGDNVEFSEGVKILCRKIGNNVIIGPNSVVTKNVPDNTTVFPPIPEYIPRDI